MMLFWLFASHFLFDYPLQGDFLARGKNQASPLPGIPWYWCMFAHALLHGAGVALITGSATIGLLEVILHFAFDHMKCHGLFGKDPHTSFSIDQCLHLFCKLLWWVIA